VQVVNRGRCADAAPAVSGDKCKIALRAASMPQ
jgi:hypothetical protein